MTDWARRGDGYYLYYETFADPENRRLIREALGPVPVLFPDDPRLDVEVVADCETATPIDRVLESYSGQSGVPLGASPFLHRCLQAGGKQTFNLREEMAFLARTFQAQWEPRGDGYYLDAGAEADAEVVPAAPAVGSSKSIWGWLLSVLGLAILAIFGRLALRFVPAIRGGRTWRGGWLAHGPTRNT